MTRFEHTTASFLLAACAVACGGGDDAAPDGDEAQQEAMPARPAAGDTPSRAQNTADDAPPACTAPEAQVIAEGTDLSALNVTADAVYYIDGGLGTAWRGESALARALYNGGIKRYSFASGETTTLWVAAEQKWLRNLLVGADAMYISLSDNASAPAVYRLPLSGQGTPEPVGPEDTQNEASAPLNGPMGIVGDELVVDGRGGPVAISLGDNSARQLLPGDTRRAAVQLVGSQLWYTNDAGRGSIFRLDVASRPPAPVAVYPGGCSNGSLNVHGWFMVVGSELICAGSRMLKVLGADGSGEKATWMGPLGDVYIPTHADDGFVYFGSGTRGMRAPRAGGNLEIFSCEAVSVGGVGSNADFLVWGQGRNSGIGSPPNPLALGPAIYETILALPR